MIIKEFNYYLKDGMTLEEIRGTILEKVNSLSDPSTGCIAHVFDANALKYYIVASDNVATLHGLDRNILTFNDFSDKVSELNSRIDSVNSELGNRINEVNSNLENSINTKANQATTYNKNEVNNLVNSKANQSTTYNKTEVNNLLNAKANSNAVVALSGNQTIAGVKTFSSVPVSATNPTANNQVANKAYVDSVGNTAVKLTGNQTVAGVKTFSALPVCNITPTADNQVANRNYVKKRGGLVAVTGGAINLNAGINFSLNLTGATNITVSNAAANIGQTGEIYVARGANIRAFNAPFNFRVAQSGFGANEVFSYLVVSANLVRITRS